LQGGETVFFQSERPRGATPGRDYVQVLGQVRSPGDYPYTPGADFYEYLIRAGGPTDRADLHNVTLVRNIGDRQREAVNFALDESDQIPAIQGGDTLLLHADNPSPLEKKSRVIGGFASILSTIATVVLLFVTV
jgi:protein involved in polysaccharide export with SLBB domain